MNGVALQDLLSVFKFFFPSMLPATKYLFQKAFTNSENGISEIHHYCSNCFEYIDNPGILHCGNCSHSFNAEHNLKKGCFFLYMPLVEQLSDLLSMSDVSKHLKGKKTRKDGSISDIMDGALYQQLLSEGKLDKDTLSVIWNCDGVPVFRSSKYSIWPLQTQLIELPPKLRKRNIMTTALWFGPMKPKMDTFLVPYIAECIKLAQDGIVWKNPSTGKKHTSKVFNLVCSADAIARPLLKNTTQFNGMYGCDWCLTPGETVPKGAGFMRSYSSKDVPILRTHQEQVNNALEAHRTHKSICGTKGPTPLMTLPLFNVVDGFVPDYLHCVLLGVMRQLASLWFDTTHHRKPWYIGNQIQDIDGRLQSFAPPSEITRLPRAMSERRHWKGSEWRAFLLFYGYVALEGILPTMYLRQFFLLSFAIHLLLQETVTTSAVEEADKMLTKFVKQMTVLYGKEHTTYNVHQLLHVPKSVLNLGPLWSTSTFSFEGNNAVLLNAFNGTRHIPEQICKTLYLRRALVKQASLLLQESTKCKSLYETLTTKKKTMKNRQPLAADLYVMTRQQSPPLTNLKKPIETLFGCQIVDSQVSGYDRFSFQGSIFTTAHYTRASRRDNSVVLVRDGAFGVLEKLVCIHCNCTTTKCDCEVKTCVVLRKLSQKHTNTCRHYDIGVQLDSLIKEVKLTDVFFAIRPCEILRKCVIFKSEMKLHVIPLPNHQETD